MNCYRTGSNNPMYGRKHKPETIMRMRLSKLSEKNPMWKGDNVSINPLHLWVKKRLPKPELCEYCEKKPPYDLACVTGIYNRDFSNWRYLCRSCHTKLDYDMGVRIGKCKVINH